MAKKHIVCRTGEIALGSRKIVKIGSRSVGIFNVAGSYYALLNKCPHMGAELCEGPLCGTNAPTEDYQYNFIRDGEILRCARHGWEFDIRTGKNFQDTSVCAKTYPVSVEDGQVVVSV